MAPENWLKILNIHSMSRFFGAERGVELINTSDGCKRLGN